MTLALAHPAPPAPARPRKLDGLTSVQATAMLADALAHPAAFRHLVLDHLHRGANPAVWQALITPNLIAAARSVLAAELTDVNSKLDLRQAALQAQRNDLNGTEWVAACTQHAEWRRRTLNFRRLVEKRLGQIEYALAATVTTSRDEMVGTLLLLTQAIAQHENAIRRAPDDVIDDALDGEDDRLWGHLRKLTVTTTGGLVLPLTEWLRFEAARQTSQVSA